MRSQNVRFVAYISMAILCVISNITALAFQILFHELPCPLCLLQRFGFLAIAYGCLLNLKQTDKSEYDIIIITSILFTMLVAVRQVLIHIAPHDPGYGSAFLGIHFYTWSVLLSMVLITSMALISVINISLSKFFTNLPYVDLLPKILRITIIILVFINVVSTYLECGFTMCPANPIKYIY